MNMKVRLCGTPQSQWNIDGSFKPGYDPVELTDEQAKKYAEIIMEYIDSKPEVIADKKKYSEKELYDMTKAEQTVILNDLGIDKIPRTEVERIKLILEAQG